MSEIFSMTEQIRNRNGRASSSNSRHCSKRDGGRAEVDRVYDRCNANCGDGEKEQAELATRLKELEYV
ncbi:hypothetical protein O9929_15665 [Vibrio lentus]|nr:hypothetical protein [Vibrio lentus]